MVSLLTPWWQLGLIGVSLVVFGVAIQRCKQGHFYSDTPYLFWMGIFVWGDALVLAPFWILAALVFIVISPLLILRYVLTFFVIRAAYEVVYWINHQVVNREYMPPLLRKITWLKPMDAAILYQLLNMCQVIIGLMLLWMTFE